MFRAQEATSYSQSNAPINWTDRSKRTDRIVPVYLTDRKTNQTIETTNQTIGTTKRAESREPIEPVESTPSFQMRRQSSAHTQTCKRLVKEWAFYVSKSKCLSKVFVSIKGIYFQAEVGLIFVCTFYCRHDP